MVTDKLPCIYDKKIKSSSIAEQNSTMHLHNRLAVITNNLKPIKAKI